MSWIDSLKGLFQITVKDLVNFNLHLHCDDHSSNKTIYDGDSNRLTINLKQISHEETQQLKSVLHEAIDEGNVILHQEANALISDFKEKDATDDGKQKLSFLTGKVPDSDLPIWRASLYLKQRFDEGKKVNDLKDDIVARCGERGRKIANLCSAGYLDQWLIPIYQRLKQNSANEEAAISAFRRLYCIFVDEFRFSVFVSSWSGKAKTKAFIQKKIEINQKYGIRFVNIHGIGIRNVKTIRQIVEEIMQTKKVTKSIKEENKIIEVRLQFELEGEKRDNLTKR